MIVLKFGGTSVKDASSMKLAYNAVSSQNDKCLVVLSACSGITDMLIALPELLVKNKEEAKELLSKIELHHINLIKELGIEDKCEAFFTKLGELADMCEGVAILGEYSERNYAKIVSFGEFLSTAIFEAYCRKSGLKSCLIDSTKFIKTDSNYSSAKYQANLSRHLFAELRNFKDNYDLAIAQGFVASDAEGKITLLGRGGSDFSAAIFGKELSAKEILIYTDVNGILSTDPRLVPQAKQLSILSFDQVRRLSFFGAKVIHPDTILPAMEANIPVKILNTFEQSNQGTTIISEGSGENEIQSLVLKRNCLLLRTDNNLPESLKDKMKVLFSAESDGRKTIIIENIPHLKANLDNLEETDIIAICGNFVNRSSGLLRIIHALLTHSAGIDIYTGFSQHAILLTVPNSHSEKVLKLLHSGLFE